MFWLNYSGHSLWLNVAIFALAAGVVWFMGTRAASYAGGITDRTRLGSAFVGLLLLGLATEMPELGTTVTASLRNQPALAVNNLFGGIVFQTMILVIVDVVCGPGALTYFTPHPALLIQSVILILLLGLVLFAATVGEIVSVFGIGLWTILLAVLYVVGLYLSMAYEREPRWEPQDGAPAPDDQPGAETDETVPTEKERYEGWPVWRLAVFFGVASLLILFAGVTLARAGEALAEQTDLGATFVGAILLAASTSLPEVSTSLKAARQGRRSMAMSNIFGSNAIMIAVLFVTDVAYRQGPILDSVDAASFATAGMGVVVTAVYVIGLLERRDRTVWRVGIDSIVVLAFGLLLFAVLYAAR